MRVATAIKLDIQSGTLKPGERLVVARLATKYSADPKTVGAALLMLQRNGAAQPVSLPTGRIHWFVAIHIPAPRGSLPPATPEQGRRPPPVPVRPRVVTAGRPCPDTPDQGREQMNHVRGR
ncbi:GntR family transcriptional regulator [Streptomyces hundungensis]|uniref:GntR family transcriptional regulator n=1 Tax=Streptomyces hundungensis TaxID=1077946 RepID=UPI0033C76B0D